MNYLFTRGCSVLPWCGPSGDIFPHTTCNYFLLWNADVWKTWQVQRLFYWYELLSYNCSAKLTFWHWYNSQQQVEKRRFAALCDWCLVCLAVVRSVLSCICDHTRLWCHCDCHCSKVEKKKKLLDFQRVFSYFCSVGWQKMAAKFVSIWRSEIE